MYFLKGLIQGLEDKIFFLLRVYFRTLGVMSWVLVIWSVGVNFESLVGNYGPHGVDFEPL